MVCKLECVTGDWKGDAYVGFEYLLEALHDCKGQRHRLAVIQTSIRRNLRNRDNDDL